MARKQKSSQFLGRTARLAAVHGRDPVVAKLATRGELRAAVKKLLATRQVPADQDIDLICEELFARLRKDCPHLLPAEPLKSGELGPEIDLDPETAQVLLSAAGQKVSGGAARDVWTQGDSDLEVFVSRLRISTTGGEIRVQIPVRCDQTGEIQASVVFVVGTDKRPAGLLAVTSGQATGPEEIVAIWSDALIAFAWGAMQELLQALAWETGVDVDRAGLIPAVLTASPEGLRVQTMARHAMDRRPR